MIEYPKIQSIFKRDEKTHKFTSEYAMPEFEYLKDNIWEWTEKVDGTNIRVYWDCEKQSVIFGGRHTEGNQIPQEILVRLQEIFPIEKLYKEFPTTSVLLFGEGYGGKIQGMDCYYGNQINFILFDVLIGQWWLKRIDVNTIADKLGIRSVPVLSEGPLSYAIEAVVGAESLVGTFIAEGFVLRPKTELFARNGRRIITKIKHKDFQ